MSNNLETLLNIILQAPAWVKEVIYIDLKKDMEGRFGAESVNKEEDMYTIHVPEITFKGKKELETHEHGHEMNIYKYLAAANNAQRVVDITLNNFWTLEESSRYLAYCIKNEYIKEPVNAVVAASVYYLGSEIRLGEYVKRINLIDVTQLDDALRKQKELNAGSSYHKLGEVLVEMGLIVNEDILKILQIKDESKKRFMLSMDFAKPQGNPQVNVKELQEKTDKLAKENAILKEKLRAIFNIQNKSAK